MPAEREEDYPLLPTENISHTTFTTLPTTPTTPTCSLSSLTKRERENLERFRAQVARLSSQNTDLTSKLARANERNSELQRLLAELRASHLHANSLLCGELQAAEYALQHHKVSAVAVRNVEKLLERTKKTASKQQDRALSKGTTGTLASGGFSRS